MSHADVPPSPNQLYKQKLTGLLVEHEADRRKLWRDSMVAFAQSGTPESPADCIEMADKILEEYDTRFKHVRI